MVFCALWLYSNNNIMFLSIFPYIILLVTAACNSTPETTVEEADLAADIKVRVVSSSFDHPWEILWGPDNKIWLTERNGKIKTLDPATGQVTTIFTIPDVKSRGEGGLLGMVLHPDFKKSPYVYVSYTYQGDGYKEKVTRFTYNGSTLSSPVVLLDNISASGIHNGSRLAIANDKLFITTGDASNQSSPQNKASLNGKVLRINLDGSIPGDNPIANSPVWSYGHRNPQGLVFAHNNLYSSEHGPNTDDEINIISVGSNYGWPNVEGFCNENNEKAFCTENKVAEPIHTWTPTAAVSGIDYYDSNAIPSWTNSILVTSLKNGILYQLQLNEAGDKVIKQNRFLQNQYGRLRDICISPDGKVYVSTGNGNEDQVLEITTK
jgi:glucose/arabinose dehydrogenase